MRAIAFFACRLSSRLRPVLTGWFAEFDALEDPSQRHVVYGEGAAAFGGATYDVTSHYRAAAVFAFHEQQGLTPDRLRAISQHQVGLLKTEFERLDVAPHGRARGADARRAPRRLPRDSSRRRRKTSRTACASEAFTLMREETSCAWDRRRILRDDQLRDAIRALREASALGSRL